MLNFSAVPAELQAQAQRYWDQFEAAIQSQGLSHPRDLLPAAVTEDEFSRQLTRAFVASEFIAKTVALRPQYLLELVQSGALFEVQTDAHLDAFTAAINASTSDLELDKCLRQQRQLAMIRIIWRDLNRAADMREITAELSRFADKSIVLAAEFHYRALEKMYGTPIGRESGLMQPFMVLGMGKLGAGELNVSSDIDLIFTYPESGETDQQSGIFYQARPKTD
jgi:[glutamine synthetase] adenylyltransferase / [glutamine synthetase]-adenylyl-L-tyrosine phosphorylase